MDDIFRFTADLWEWQGEAAWFFVTMPAEDAEEIRRRPRPKRGFGSVRVRATIGGSQWSTSIFPDSKAGSYLLPVKKAIRTTEGIAAGDPIEVELELLE
jgi:hypothetical protein